MTTYTLHDQDIMQRCIMHIQKLPQGKLWDVKIGEHKSKRSNAQNSLYWLWLSEISEQYGVPDLNGVLQKHTEDDWHDLCRMKWLGVKVITIGHKEYPRPAKSTTKLNTSEFTEYLMNIEAHFLDKGVSLTFPDMYGRAMGIENNQTKTKKD